MSDGRAVKIEVRLARRRAPLALIARAVLLRAVRVLSRRAQSEEAQLTNLHPRPELDRQGRHIGQLQSHMAREAGIDESGRCMGEQTQSAEGRLALHASGDDGVTADPATSQAPATSP